MLSLEPALQRRAKTVALGAMPLRVAANAKNVNQEMLPTIFLFHEIESFFFVQNRREDVQKSYVFQ